MSRVLLIAVALVSLSSPATGFEYALQKGDFYYDAEGRLAGMRHVEYPEGFERVPMSFREKYELLGLRLPARPAELEPRYVHPKPSSVPEHEGLMRGHVIVKFADTVRVRMRDGNLTALEGSIESVRTILADYPEAEVLRAFRTEERILDEDRDTGERISGKELADLNNYYLIRFPEGQEGVELANRLLGEDAIETAYLMAKAEPPGTCADLAPVTPLWEANQNYLQAAPNGVDAYAAWAHHPGGNGAGSDFWVCDLEWGWCFSHEDLDITAADVINGSSGGSSTDHGTAVLGEIGACDNDYGMTGISPDVQLKMSDFDSEPTWGSNILTAATTLAPGEVMLLEIHIPGPDTGESCQCNCGQFEYVPVEWDQASYDAIATGTANGVIVVEAGGNGSSNLDDGVYEGKFNRMVRDSGAILVGAGMPGSHSPECWTNYGWIIDAHGYGSSVYTGGYGSLQNLTGCSQDYSNSFGGTSAASPMIVGVCAAMQGIANEKFAIDISPSEMRDLIKVNGTPQGAPLSKLIRAMPDLSEMIAEFEGTSSSTPRTGPAPGGFALAAPTPNPFTGETTVTFDLPAGGADVELAVYDLRGRRVAGLVDGARPAGRHAVTWSGIDGTGRRVSAGVYFVRLETASFQETRKITLLP